MKNIDFNATYKSESEMLAKTTEWLKSKRRHGVMVMRINDRVAKGYSDLLVCVRGVFVALELKDDTGKPSVHQLEFIEEVQKAGGVAGVCDTVGQVRDLIKQAVSISGRYDSTEHWADI